MVSWSGTLTARSAGTLLYWAYASETDNMYNSSLNKNGVRDLSLSLFRLFQGMRDVEGVLKRRDPWNEVEMKTSCHSGDCVLIDHFTVVCSVTWPLYRSEARVDLVLIQTSLLLLCKISCSDAN